MSPAMEVLVVLASSLAVLTGALVTRSVLKAKYDAEVEHVRSEIKHTDANTQAVEVKVIREILNTVVESDQRKTEQIGELRNEVRNSAVRIGTLEDRERHNLTRIAVHEAWDQIAYSKLLETYPTHPAPPPLRSDSPLTVQDTETVTHSRTQISYGESSDE